MYMKSSTSGARNMLNSRSNSEDQLPIYPHSELEEKDIFLRESLVIVRNQSRLMKIYLDKGEFKEGLRCASNFLGELKTSYLQPKSYYELYMAIIQELHYLENYLYDQFSNFEQTENLYQLMQRPGNIVPRLYLLITVGLVYIKHDGSLTKSIMMDLVEMCRGVQDPLRGLFLRNYLLTLRSILPDTLPSSDSDDDDEWGNVNDSVDFILNNFTEMNKLWVRMQHAGHSSERSLREKEREELKILVGTNLVRLSQLDSVNTEIYQRTILPRILEQVISCRDAIAQEYLMDCIIQVFPDEFHLQTLDLFLKSCTRLQSEVNVKSILISLINRLAAYHQRNEELRADWVVPIKIHLFDVFSHQIAVIVRVRTEMSLEDRVGLQIALVNFAQNVHPDKIDCVDKAFETTNRLLENFGIYSRQVNEELYKLLWKCVDFYDDILVILMIKNFSKLISKLDFGYREELALHMIKKILKTESIIPTDDQVDVILEMLSPLIRDQNDEPEDGITFEAFSEQQEMVGCLIHQLKSDDLDMQFRILEVAVKHLKFGQTERIKITMPTVVFQLLKLAKKFKKNDENWNEKCQKVIAFCSLTIELIARAELPELALRLYLQAAMVAGEIGFSNYEAVAYDFMTKAFLIYEESISDLKEKVAAITMIISTTESMSFFNEDNAEPLRTNCAIAASKLLKKTDQCRSVLKCASLFWSGKNDNKEIRDEKRTLECLKKATRIASQCLGNVVQAQLYLELLNNYLLYFERGNSLITTSMFNQLITKINEVLPSLDKSEETTALEAHFQRTQARIKQKAGFEVSFSEIKI
ncbi:unnamed protein product [Chironomus riparius]|uniref:Vacuolar protein sorting-associated protein 35 n=1 Tax=Chironomus riparius TaxID=315576 RepID=A0A9N9WRK0_9DIPT|nr:unnamed protein product [Chironomus riparius]